MQDFAFVEEFLHRARDFFNRHFRIDAMNVIQIDVIGAEPLQRTFHCFAQSLRTRIKSDAFAISNIPAAFRRELDAIAHGLESLADQFFIAIDRIHFRRVEEVDAEFNRLAQEFNAFVFRRERRITLRQAHATEPDLGNLQLLAARVDSQNSFLQSDHTPQNY